MDFLGELAEVVRARNCILYGIAFGVLLLVSITLVVSALGASSLAAGLALASASMSLASLVETIIDL